MRVRARDDLAMSGLRRGKEYVVLGLDDQYFRVLNNEEEPVLFPRSAFIVLDDHVPEDWVWRRYSDGQFLANPPEMASRGFYDAFFDRKKWALTALAGYLKRAGIKREPRSRRQRPM